MKRYIVPSLLLALFIVSTIHAIAPPMEVPPAPPVSAQIALSTANDYVKNKFPKIKFLYCSEMIYSPENYSSEKKIVWRFTYRIPGNKRIENSTGSPRWGDALVFVYDDGSASHGIAPFTQK